MTQSVDYANMKLNELADEWNQMVTKAKELGVPGTWVHVVKFKDKPTAVARCTKLCGALASVVAEKLLEGSTAQAVLESTTPMVDEVVDATLGVQTDVMEDIARSLNAMADALPPTPTTAEAKLAEVMLKDGCSKKKVNGHVPHEEPPEFLSLTPEERKAAWRSWDKEHVKVEPVKTGTTIHLKPSQQTVSAIAARPAVTDRRSGYSMSAKITVLVSSNPKRVGTAGRDRFEFYRDGMTVAEALEAGLTRPDLKWDSKHAFIKIEEKK